MKKILLAVTGLALMGSACKDGNSCDSGDSVCESTTDDSNGGDCFDIAVEIDSATYNCDETAWWYDVYAVGLTGNAELYIYQTGSGNPWFEYGHEYWPTDPFSSAPDADTRGYYDDAEGCWDNPYLELDHVETPGEVALSSTTLFDCTTERENTLTWSVVVYDTNGNAADCGSWGDDPTGTYESYNFGGCDLL